ncbi:TPA: PerC family transcriptional regulator [Klebsiella aerogenes]|nr:PerC family transcriptional regulator [Klebsiella aerogenes]
MAEVVRDTVAEKLEAAGLWRRAARRWLDIMESGRITDAQRDWLHQRRQTCLANIVPVKRPSEQLDIVTVSKAASAAQARMGLARPDGRAFRIFTGPKK